MMGRRGRRMTAIGVTAVALSAIGVGGVLAGSQSADEAALQPVANGHGHGSVEWRINKLLRQMTLDEKLQQLTLLSDGQITDAEAAKPVGGVFSLVDPEKI